MQPDCDAVIQPEIPGIVQSLAVRRNDKQVWLEIALSLEQERTTICVANQFHVCIKTRI